MPLASRLHAEGDRSLLRALYTASTRFTIGMFTAVAGGLIVFAGPFLSAWVGPRFAHSSDIVVILTFAGLAEALLWPAAELLQGMNRHRPLVVFALGSAALNLTLSIILIGPLGVKGVAYGTLIATGIEALIVVPFAGRVTGVAGRTVFRDVLVPSVPPGDPDGRGAAADPRESRPLDDRDDRARGAGRRGRLRRRRTSASRRPCVSASCSTAASCGCAPLGAPRRPSSAGPAGDRADTLQRCGFRHGCHAHAGRRPGVRLRRRPRWPGRP